MHPIESTTYYTAMLLPAALAAAAGAAAGVHPIVLLYTKMDLTIAALVGHDGYGYPGAASQAHWMHHNNMDCNYGAPRGQWRRSLLHGASLRSSLPPPPPRPPPGGLAGENYAPFDWLFGTWAKDEADFLRIKDGWAAGKGAAAAAAAEEEQPQKASSSGSGSKKSKAA